MKSLARAKRAAKPGRPAPRPGPIPASRPAGDAPPRPRPRPRPGRRGPRAVAAAALPSTIAWPLWADRPFHQVADALAAAAAEEGGAP